MQTCSRCQTQSPDTSTVCLKCGADLIVESTAAQTLLRLRNNPRVTAVRVVIAKDACPACYEHAGVYTPQAAPLLPVAGCSHVNGCRCYYEPILSEVYP